MTVAVDLGLGNPLTQARRFIAGMPYRVSIGSRAGYLAGEFPDGITTVKGAPVSATVRILYRPAAGALGDGVVVAEVQSAPDGTWRVDGLNLALKYDVVGRKSGHNDVIVSNVQPANPLRLRESSLIIAIGTPVDYKILALGGSGLISVSLVGVLPSGVVFDDGALRGAWPTGEPGHYPVSVTLTDELANSATVVFTIELLLLGMTLTAPTLPSIISVNRAMSPAKFTAGGGEGPYTYSILSGSLPLGMLLDTSTGELSGTPEQLGAFSFVVGAHDVRGTTVGAVVDLEVGDPSHRYWRVYVTETNPGGYGSMVELEFLDSQMVRNALAGGAPIASSELSGHAAANAFDGVTAGSSSPWAPTIQAPPMWLGYVHAAAVAVGAVRITAREYYSSQSPKTFSIQYSDDGIAWTTSWTVTDQMGWSPSEQRTFLRP